MGGCSSDTKPRPIITNPNQNGIQVTAMNQNNNQMKTNLYTPIIREIDFRRGQMYFGQKGEIYK